MNKTISICIPLIIVTLLISATTAVPHVQGNQVMQKVDEMQQRKDVLEAKCIQIMDKINNHFKNKVPFQAGIIELIIQLILLLIRIVESIIQFILDIMELGTLIEYLIGRILFLIDLIIQFIEWILGIFNPAKIETIGY
jgi:hypothetical protein